MTDTPAAAPHSAPLAAEPQPASVANLKMLSPDTREAMLSVAERMEIAAGDVLFAENESGNELFIIETGRVVGFRAGREDDEDWPVLHLAEGDIVGELSFLDGAERHITARAETDCTLLRISPFDLLLLDGGDHFYDNLRASVGITVVSRLRVGTDIHVATLDHQLELARTQQQFGQFFIYIIAMFSIGMVVSNIVATQLIEINVYTEVFAWQYLAVLMIPSLVIVRMMKIPLRDLGLTTNGMRKSVTEGLAVSAVFVAASVCYYFASHTFEAIPPVTLSFDPWGSVSYFAHSFLQEVVARGLLQSSFQRFLKDRKGYRAVFLSAMLFGMFHIHFGMAAVVMVFLTSVLFGLFYLRHQNIAGVTIFHYFAGACAFAMGML